ncbi:MAG: N-acetylmuramoyl-L-alanine amidase [Bacteroidetes bacterium]|nr:N-acetylmuramoyl-L-alanine amidase [Bacteroidota bacterium]
MYKFIIATWCLSLAVMLSGVEASFAQVNSDSLIAVYTQKMQKYLVKDNSIYKIISLCKAGVDINPPESDTSELGSIINWNVVDDLLKIQLKEKINLTFVYGDMAVGISEKYSIRDSLKPLLHYKIALDPGHIAGDLATAKMEKKWVEMKKAKIQLIEGELALATALILKKKLEAEGATVMLTRDKPNISSFGIDFKKWKDSLFHKSLDSAYARGDVSFEERNFLLKKANDTEIFRRFFLLEEMHERARKINEFHPDLTLVIHYNVDETNKNWNKPTKKDFVMAFVGGSFSAEELDKPEARIDFLRLLLTDDIEHSIEFSKYIVNSLSEKLDVPVALDSCAIYLRDNCITTSVNGVFCRNLTLTRMVKGTLCYGESLYQDNIKECKALSKKDASTPLSVTNGIKTSKRVEEVAKAYYEGIINYVKKKTP